MKITSLVAACGMVALATAAPALKVDYVGLGLKFNSTNEDCATSCGGSGDIASNVEVSISGVEAGCVLKKGGSFALSSSYDLSEDVTGGTATYQASLNGLPVLNKQDDLCTDLKDGTTPCPLKKGHVKSVGKPQPMSEKVPSGTFLAQQKWEDKDGKPILCLQYQLKVE